MLSRSFVKLSMAAGLVAAATLGLSGCTTCYQPSKAPVVKKRGPAPRSGGAATIGVSPETAVNPVRTQHVLVATVRDASGNPVAGERVEWILAGGGVGDIVDVDGGDKIDNSYAVSTTAASAYVLDRGNSDPSDDVSISPGQTWAVITSAVEGTSNVVAYAPGISNWDNHKAFATKNWMDVTWEWPVDATNRVGNPHTFSTRVMRYSDGTPLAGYHVVYTILSGPSGSFSSGGQSTTATTDGSGVASATLNQSSPAVGTNEVEVSIVRPANTECCLPEKHIISGVVRKNWVAPSIKCSKTGPSTVTEGDTFDYTVTVTNDSDLDVNGVTLSDQIPAGLAYNSSSPAGSASGNSVSWNLGSIAPMSSKTVTINVTARGPGTVENCAEVSAEGGALSDRCCAVTNIEKRREPALTINCNCPDRVLICDPIVWSCTVTNTGDGVAANVKVSCRPDDPGAINCTPAEHFVGNLGAGESRTVTANCTAARTGRISMTCTATADGGLTASSSCSTQVDKPVLSISKSANRANVFIGRPIEYQITVSNTGSVEARDVVLTDAVPAGTSFISATDGGSLQGGQVVWNLGSMPGGATKTVGLTVKAGTGGTVRNVATARGFCADQVSAEVKVEVEGIPAILLEVIDVEDPIEVGNTETYVIDVTNQGSAPALNVVIKCTMPAQQEFVSADGGGVTHTVSGKVITFAPLPPLPAKARHTYRIVVRATAAGDVRFATELTSRMLTTPVNETESTHQY